MAVLDNYTAMTEAQEAQIERDVYEHEPNHTDFDATFDRFAEEEGFEWLGRVDPCACRTGGGHTLRCGWFWKGGRYE